MQLSELLKDTHSNNYIHVTEWEKYFYFLHYKTAKRNFKV